MLSACLCSPGTTVPLATLTSYNWIGSPAIRASSVGREPAKTATAGLRSGGGIHEIERSRPRLIIQIFFQRPASDHAASAGKFHTVETTLHDNCLFGAGGNRWDFRSGSRNADIYSRRRSLCGRTKPFRTSIG